MKTKEQILKEMKEAMPFALPESTEPYILLAMKYFAEAYHEDKTRLAERFKMPTDKQIIDIAILFNDGELDAEKLGGMVGMCQFVLDRLYENGDVGIHSKSEDAKAEPTPPKINAE